MSYHNKFKQSIELFRVKDLLKYVAEDKVNFFDVSQTRIRTIRNYIVDNILNNEIYFPPLVVARYTEEAKEDSRLSDQLTIIDGNGRLLALSQISTVIDQKQKSLDPKELDQSESLRIFISESSIAIQIYEGLNQEEIMQAYVDFNTKGKKVALSKLIAYDSRNEINRISNDVLEQNTDLVKAKVERELKSLKKPNNKSFLTLSQLRKIISIFLTSELKSELPKGNIKNKLNYEENIDLINEWFKSLFKLHPPDTIGNYHKTMLASFSILQAIAYYAIRGTSQMNYESKLKTIQERMSKIYIINFSPNHEQWELFKGVRRGKDNYYYLSGNKDDVLKIERWLTKSARKEVSTY
ncbi:DNA sulfur modification protein DndB [Paenibacillus kribbensis]|uniref:DNA sulfur modification protein DndB n=1 Tax=Paenibacillus kribbensis TaxID=172713 RepID=UPI0015BEEFDB|nr:DNA sulfur modification protein DndB [Paenibacillus kribbensis]